MKKNFENNDAIDEVDVMSQYLNCRKMFARNKIAEQECGGTVFTLFIPKWGKHSTLTAHIANTVLVVLWLPVLILGIYCFSIELPYLNDSHIIPGCIVGTAAGLFFHELGHAFSCISYGGTVYEFGVAVKYLMPGAYAMIDVDNITGRMQRIQVYAAGVETNFLLAGIFLIMASYIPGAGTVFLSAATSNILIALINLLFVSGIDGNSIMSELLGIDNPSETVKAVLKSRRMLIREKGISGFIIVAVCGIMYLMQAAVLLLLIVNIMGVAELCML